MGQIEDGLGRSLITVEEAKEKGFAEPQDVFCEWCGEPLEQRGIVFGGRVAWIAHENCGCEGERAARAAAERAADDEKRLQEEKNLERAGIGKRFLQAKVDGKECENFIRRFGSDEGRGLYIHGGVGTGKTYTASALAREFVDSGYAVVLTTTLSMLEDIQDTYGKEASSLEAVSRFSKCDVLILDDLGKESASAWSISMLFQIIDVRYEAMRPLIVTTQYDYVGLERRLSRQGEAQSAKAIVSRLREMCRPMQLRGGDRRLTAM